MDRGWVTRLSAVAGWGPVAAVRGVLARYDAAGGGLLAGGLAYSALFALVPLTILIAGIVGLLVTDAVRQAAVVTAIADVLPPLRDVVAVVLAEAASAAGAISFLGGLALVWGASRFVVAFDGAMHRIFGGEVRRGFVTRNVAAFAAVLGLIGAVVLGVTLAGVSSFLDAAETRAGPIAGTVSDVAYAVLPPLAAVGSIALVYRYVPVDAPRWRAIAPPAVVVGVVITVLARAFVFIAPRLIGAAATIGALATAFAALTWLSASFQAILLGAAWVRERDSARDRVGPAAPPTISAAEPPETGQHEPEGDSRATR